MIKQKQFLLLFLFLIPLFYGCKNNTEKADTTEQANRTIPVYDFETFEHLLYTEENKTYIVNFWAMWCAPCVKEMPILQEYEKNNPNVNLILVSMDFPEDIDTKLIPFLDKKGINAKVVLLDAPDANSWIDKVNPNWSGSIPYTIIFNNKNRSYHERAFENLKDLETEVNNTINK
ncbi:thioredoxin-like protein [unidentified eubacterium SCB49]|nr:thioredoxin-like protein [unidentified eubacterium SCB49]